MTEGCEAEKRQTSSGTRTVIVRMARDTTGTLADDECANLSMSEFVCDCEVVGGMRKEQDLRGSFAATDPV